MNRRVRAALFAGLALASALLAVGLTGRYGDTVAAQFGEPQPVAVAKVALRTGTRISAKRAEGAFTIQRIPARFVPGDTISDPRELIGATLGGPMSRGSFLTTSLIRQGPRRQPQAKSLDPKLRAVDLAVTGAGALGATGQDPIGRRVDVVVTTEPGVTGRGRTFQAAADVPLLALASSNRDVVDGAPVWMATLALTKTQALRLIDAENFARQVRLLLAGRSR